MPSVDRPVATVLNDIVGNVQDIVRAEFRMVRTELAEEAGKVRKAGLLLGVGTSLLIFCVLFLLLAAVYALSLVVPEWAAALIVGAGAGLLAALFVGVGVKRFKAVRAVPKTADSVKENVEWAKQLTR